MASKSYTFENATFLIPGARPTERIRMLGLSARVTVEESSPILWEMRRSDIARYIVRNILDGTSQTFVRPRPKTSLPEPPGAEGRP